MSRMGTGVTPDPIPNSVVKPLVAQASSLWVHRPEACATDCVGEEDAAGGLCHY
jgi:hypothetical protein